MGSVAEKSASAFATIALVFTSAAIIYLHLAACSISWLPASIGWIQCSGLEKTARSAADILDEIDRESDAILDEIDQLRRAVGNLQCDPVVPEEPPQSKPEEPEQRAECTDEKRAVQSSEVVFILDSSRSMDWSVDLPEALERDLRDAYLQVEDAKSRGLAGVLGLAGASRDYDRLLRRAANYPGTKRRVIAKRITSDAIADAPEDMSIGLVTFDECAPYSHGIFPPQRRGEVLGLVDRTDFDNSTPIAASIATAAGVLKGGASPDDAVNIVLLTDGDEACGGDPCAAARQAKSRKPGLVINVIDLSKTSRIKCVADATGGFYRRHQEGMDLAELTRSMREAAGYEGEGLCRK